MDFLNSFNRKKGTLVLDESGCDYCGRCGRECPHLAIRVSPERKTWKLRLICMKCGRCVRVCPRGALSLQKRSE